MKKPGVILSVIIVTMTFIYTMSLVSSQNVCTGVRSYECVALQQTAPTQQVSAAQTSVQQASLPSQIQQTVSKVFTSKKSITPTQQVVASIPKTTTSSNTNSSVSSSLAAQQAAAAAQLAQQQAATAATQQAAAAAQQQAAAQQAASTPAPVVNTVTRAS